MLVGLTYAAAAVRMSRRGVLAQQLNAIESLASVDTICVDKTGTLTEASLRVVEVVPAAGSGPRSRSAPALADAGGQRVGAQHHAAGDRARPSRPSREPGARRGSVLEPAPLERGRVALRAASISGRPGRVPARRARRRSPSSASSEGRRVLALAAATGPAADDRPATSRRPDSSRSGSSCSRRSCGRTCKRDDRVPARAGGRDQGALRGRAADRRRDRARRRDPGRRECTRAATIPEDPVRAGAFALDATVVGRISPRGQAGDRAGADATRAATSRWSATASTTSPR